MFSEKQARILDALPPEPRARAVDLSESAGVLEYCFPIAFAGEILTLLLAEGTVPLGDDLWEGDPSGFCGASSTRPTRG
jgi:hypothetical protein